MNTRQVMRGILTEAEEPAPSGLRRATPVTFHIRRRAGSTGPEVTGYTFGGHLAVHLEPTEQRQWRISHIKTGAQVWQSRRYGARGRAEMVKMAKALEQAGGDLWDFDDPKEAYGELRDKIGHILFPDRYDPPEDEA